MSADMLLCIRGCRAQLTAANTHDPGLYRSYKPPWHLPPRRHVLLVPRPQETGNTVDMPASGSRISAGTLHIGGRNGAAAAKTRLPPQHALKVRRHGAAHLGHEHR